MIHWLLQSATDCMLPPGEWLSAAEQEQAAALRTAKRRHDWLLGRWTAKRLVESRTGARLREIVIGNAADGAPFARLANGTIPLSLSHAGDYALCACSPPGSPMVVGADIERIQLHSEAFINDYFTRREIAFIRHAAVQLRHTLVTAMWSGKEATLKALRTGLRVDTRAVEGQFAAMAVAPAVWTNFEIRCDAARLGIEPPPLRGWWRVIGGYVLTMAVSVTGATE